MKESSEELLANYVEGRREDVFGELVRRHIGLVYHTALRVANGDAHLAQDVAQTVFSDLARKAGSISSGTVVAGWLHQHAWFTASKMIRTERRRQVREEASMDMGSSATGEENSELNLKLESALDEALTSLKPEERDAVVLRYFEQAELRRIGALFGISEDAAQKRVARAVEKLREVFAARGLTVSTAGLVAFLSSQSLAAPPALATVVTSSALVAGATAAGTAGVGAFLASTKGKLAVAAACAIAVGTPMAWQQQRLSGLQAENARLAGMVSSNEMLRAEIQMLRRQTFSEADIADLNKQLLELQRLRGEVTMLKKQAAEAGVRAEKSGNGVSEEQPKEAQEALQVMLEARIAELSHDGMAALLKKGFPAVPDPKNFNLKMEAQTAAAALRLFEETEGVDILSAPKVTTMDGREARVMIVRDDLALPDGTSVPQGVEVGFVPTVQPDRETTDLKIHLQTTEFVGWDEAKSLPKYRTRSVDHEDSLRHGEVAVLGRSVVTGDGETREAKLRIYWISAMLVDRAGNAITAKER